MSIGNSVFLVEVIALLSDMLVLFFTNATFELQYLLEIRRWRKRCWSGRWIRGPSLRLLYHKLCLNPVCGLLSASILKQLLPWVIETNEWFMYITCDTPILSWFVALLWSCNLCWRDLPINNVAFEETEICCGWRRDPSPCKASVDIFVTLGYWIYTVIKPCQINPGRFLPKVPVHSYPCLIAHLPFPNNHSNPGTLKSKSTNEIYAKLPIKQSAKARGE